MPRKSGCANTSDYKYKVTEGCETNYFVSQKEIQDKYDLRRTAIYFMIHSPEKRKDHRGLTIQKLDEPLPVYNIVNEDQEGERVIKYQKINY